MKPFEEKVFKQYFMPYKGVGAVKNATVDGAINFEITDNQAEITAYTTAEYEFARVSVLYKGICMFEEMAAVSPEKVYHTYVDLKGGETTDYTVRLSDEDGRTIVEFTPLADELPKLPSPAEAAKEPEQIMTNEELYLTGLHIEQYRHATYLPDPYYLEGLKRDPDDSRINTAYGSLMLTRGLFVESETYFRRAVKRLTWKNPNPYDSEAYYKLGLSLFYQKRYDEAYDMFYKAAWSSEQQEMSFYYLAVISCIRKEYNSALELMEKGLVKNWHNVKARGLKAVILRKLERMDEAADWIRENLKLDPFDYVSLSELCYGAEEEERNQLQAFLEGGMRGYGENYLQLARDYAEAGFYEEAVQSDQAFSHPLSLYFGDNE